MRAGAHHAVTRHPLHLAVVLIIQPCLEFWLTGREIGIGDTHVLKTKLSAPLFNVLR